MSSVRREAANRLGTRGVATRSDVEAIRPAINRALVQNGEPQRLAWSPVAIRLGGEGMEPRGLGGAPNILGRKSTRRRALQAVTTSASGVGPGPLGPPDHVADQGRAFDLIGAAAARLRSAVRSDDVPLPIVCLPSEERATVTPS